MTEFKTDVSKKYELTFKTDNEDYYRLMECLARQLIDKQQVVILRESRFDELCAHDADYVNLRTVLVNFMQEINVAINVCPPRHFNFMQKECVKALSKAKEALNDL